MRQEGIKALWTGTTPNILRNSVVNAAELATYDQVGRQKPFWLKGWKSCGRQQRAQVQGQPLCTPGHCSGTRMQVCHLCRLTLQPCLPCPVPPGPPALQIKQALMHSLGFQDNVYCHLSASLCAGFIAVSCGSGGACWTPRQWAVV